MYIAWVFFAWVYSVAKLHGCIAWGYCVFILCVYIASVY